MSPATARRLLAIHRWSGVVSSVLFVFFGATGLVLLFHGEINSALGVRPREASASTLGVADAIARVQDANVRERVVSVAQAPDDYPNIVFVSVTSGRAEAARVVAVDRARGEIVPSVKPDGSFTSIVLRLHAQLLAGPKGSILVGALGLVLVVSLGTGAIVYGPMMRRFHFGLLRGPSRRLLMADLHKLAGIATFGWTILVTITGILLAWGAMLLSFYVNTALSPREGPSHEKISAASHSAIDEAIANAERASGREWSFIALPSSEPESSRDYMIVLRGGEKMEARVVDIAFVDARNPSRVSLRPLPRIMKALLVPQPLHFGDYGGWPLRLLWAFFTLVSLMLSITGVGSLAARGRTRTVAAEVDTPAARPVEERT